MKENSRNYRKKEQKIDAIETTNERLTGRAGLALFVAYLHQIQVFLCLTDTLARYGRVRRAYRSSTFSNRSFALWPTAQAGT